MPQLGGSPTKDSDLIRIVSQEENVVQLECQLPAMVLGTNGKYLKAFVVALDYYVMQKKGAGEGLNPGKATRRKLIAEDCQCAPRVRLKESGPERFVTNFSMKLAPKASFGGRARVILQVVLEAATDSTFWTPVGRFVEAVVPTGDLSVELLKSLVTCEDDGGCQTDPVLVSDVIKTLSQHSDEEVNQHGEKSLPAETLMNAFSLLRGAIRSRKLGHEDEYEIGRLQALADAEAASARKAKEDNDALQKQMQELQSKLEDALANIGRLDNDKGALIEDVRKGKLAEQELQTSLESEKRSRAELDKQFKLLQEELADERQRRLDAEEKLSKATQALEEATQALEEEQKRRQESDEKARVAEQACKEAEERARLAQQAREEAEEQTRLALQAGQEANAQGLEDERKKREDAEEQARLAEIARLEAEDRAALAEQGRRDAEERARIAEEKCQDAEERARLAEAGRKEAEEHARKAQEAVEEAMKLGQLDQEERQRAEQEMRWKMEQEEAERKRKAEEEAEQRRKDEEEREEARRKAEEERELARKQAEEDRLKAEGEGKLRADEEARLKAEEARLKAEEEARLKAEEEARRRAEEEARLRAEELARLAAEEADEEELKGANRTRLRVKVVRAENLRAADIGGKSDPYCIVHVAGQHEDASHPPFKTDIQKKTLAPVWNQEHVFDACTLTEELFFEVFDHDDGKKDDSLGSIIVSPFEFRPDGFKGHFLLGEKKRRSMFKKSKSTMTNAETGEIIGPTIWIEIEVLPMIRNPAVPRLFVKLLSASGLRAADRGGKSDPYCLCEVAGKPMSRFKTQVIKKTLNPEWNEEAEITGFMKGDNLDIHVYDHDGGNKVGDNLGTIILSNAQFDPTGFSGTVQLTGAGSKEGSTLTFSVDVF